MMEFISWDDDYSQLNGKNESHVPNHQPVILITQIKNYHISHHFLFLSRMELQSWGVNMIAPRFSPEL